MEEYIVTGKHPLHGTVKIHGAKNAVLPMLAATIINAGISVIENVPDIQDVWKMLAIIRLLGGTYSFEDGILVVDTKNCVEKTIPKDFANQIRTSVLFCGAMLARFGKCTIAKPGGCAIGRRPIDMHLDAFSAMGVDIVEEEENVTLRAKEMKAIHYKLPFPSVGATQNIILAATMARGKSQIDNAAKEPEVIELAQFLNGMGAKILGAGTECIRVEGNGNLSDTGYYVQGDRIVAGTYMAACAVSGGDVRLTGICPKWCDAFLDCFLKMGCSIMCDAKGVEITSSGELISPGMIVTMPYPAFPTDMQPQFMSMLSLAKGVSILKETIFENRFSNAGELQKMGADIAIYQNMAFIEGKKLSGGQILNAHDLRGGAALIIAALGTEGKSIVRDDGYIRRGYENIRRDLQLLGADIV